MPLFWLSSRSELISGVFPGLFMGWAFRAFSPLSQPPPPWGVTKEGSGPQAASPAGRRPPARHQPLPQRRSLAVPVSPMPHHGPIWGAWGAGESEAWPRSGHVSQACVFFPVSCSFLQVSRVDWGRRFCSQHICCLLLICLFLIQNFVRVCGFPLQGSP